MNSRYIVVDDSRTPTRYVQLSPTHFGSADDDVVAVTLDEQDAAVFEFFASGARVVRRLRHEGFVNFRVVPILDVYAPHRKRTGGRPPKVTERHVS